MEIFKGKCPIKINDANTSYKPADKTGWKKYSYSRGYFSVDIPSNWIVDDKEMPGYLYSPQSITEFKKDCQNARDLIPVYPTQDIGLSNYDSLSQMFQAIQDSYQSKTLEEYFKNNSSIYKNMKSTTTNGKKSYIVDEVGGGSQLYIINGEKIVVVYFDDNPISNEIISTISFDKNN